MQLLILQMWGIKNNSKDNFGDCCEECKTSCTGFSLLLLVEVRITYNLIASWNWNLQIFRVRDK